MRTLWSIFRDFIPLIAAFFIPPQIVGLGIALLIVGWMLYSQAKTRSLKTLTIINAAYFVIATIVTLFDPNTNILEYGLVTTYVILAVTTTLSLFVGDLFTIQYAKETTPQAVWTHPLFTSINRRLTVIWSVSFTLSALFACLTQFAILSGVAGTVLTYIWMIPGLIANSVLPPRMQRQFAERMKTMQPQELNWNPAIADAPPAEPYHYDVIVVGSGIGGLTAAVELAALGSKVLVLEQHYLFGGACSTYTRKGGFKFEAGVESISGLGEQGPVNHLLKRHGLEGAITWLKNTYEYRDGNQTKIIPNDYWAWRDQLIAEFPHERTGIEAMFTEIKACYDGMYSVFAPDRLCPRKPESMEEMTRFAEMYPEFLRWSTSTWKEFLDGFVREPALRAQMSMLTGYVGDAGEETPAGTMIALMGYFLIGGFRPQGGGGELAMKLVEKLREYGGEALLSQLVQSIIVADNQVHGVVTKKGVYYAPVVISNVDPRVTYEKLVGLDKLPLSYQEKVRRLEPSTSLLIWTAAIDCEFATSHLIHYSLPKPIHLASIDQRIEGFGIHSASALDSTLAPKGKGTLHINMLTKAEASRFQAMTEKEYAAVKAEVDRVCRELLREIDPQAADSILFTEVATPRTVAHYMRTHEGSVYNSKRLDGEASPFPTFKAPIEGLYLVGAGVGYGPGIEAVVISGGDVASQLGAFFAERKKIQTA
ncbi:phytoene desaturase family protein [Brevibacillus fluminis]|uniref:phytoene desaturase family protein n=1 Tax=Brevibacillus fluminis TaxID=511487 RepID=UPI003F8CD4FE